MSSFPSTVANGFWCCGMVGCSKQIDTAKKSLIVYHKNTHFPKYACEHCKEVFPQKSRLEVHIRTTHTGEKPYKCNHCEKAFPQLSNLNDHMVKNHADVHVATLKPAPKAPLPKLDYTTLYANFYRNEMNRLKNLDMNMTHAALVSEIGRLWREKKNSLCNHDDATTVPRENPGSEFSGVVAC
jgi:hypothetical protein